VLASVDASPSPVAGVRVITWIAAATLSVAAAILYLPIIIGLVRQWIDDPDAAYGIVVAIAAAFVLKARLPRLRHLPRTGSWFAIVFVLAAAVLYLVGTLAADLFVIRLSMGALATSALWFVAGGAHVRALAAPLALAVVAIPLPDAVVTEFTLPLQLVASQSAAAMLGVAGVPVVRDGNVLALGSVTLEVAQACSGMRSLVTLVALVAVYGAIRELPWRRIALLAVATIPVALAGNSLRIAVTALLATTSLGADAARGLIHDATGWAAFALMCALLFGVSVRSDRGQTRVGSGSDPDRNAVGSGSDRGQSTVAGRLNLPGRTT
jgi:exosortase